MQSNKAQSSLKGQVKKKRNRGNYNLRYIDPNGVSTDEPYSSNWSVETKAFLTSQNLKSLFFSEDWVFISVDAYAQPLSSLPLIVTRKSEDNGQSIEKPVQFHPVSQLLENPNQYVDGVALKYSLVCDYVLGGNCFLYHAKQNKQLYHVSFDRVQYKFTQQGLPDSYIVYPDTDEIIPNVTKGISIAIDEMIHARRPNPSSPLWGLSPFIAGRRAVLFNRFSQDYLNSFYLKGATPQFILEMEQNANEQSVLRLLRSFEIAHTGRRNQRRTMLLPKGVKATTADHKIADQQITELVRMNRETILNTLHIPKHVVSLQEAGSLGSEEHKMSLKYFWTAALIPTANAISAALTKHFRKSGMLAVNEQLVFDTSEVSTLQDDMKSNAETASALLTTHTINEVRATIFGLPPLDGGDALPGQAQPQLPFLNMPSPVMNEMEQEDDDGADFEVKAIPQIYSEIDFKPTQDVSDEAATGLEWRRKYNRGGTEVGVARAVQLKNRRTVSPETIKRMVSYFARHSGEGDNKQPNGEPSAGAIAWKLWGGNSGKRWSEKIRDQMQAAEEKEKSTDSVEAIQRQSSEIESVSKTKEMGRYSSQVKANEDSLDSFLKKELVGTTELALDFLAEQTKVAVDILKAAKKSKATLPSEKEYKKRLDKGLKKLESDYLNKFDEPLESAVDLGYDLQLNLIFDKPSRDALEAAKAKDKNNRSILLKARNIDTFESLNKTTTNLIMKIITLGLKDNLSIDDVAKLIVETSIKTNPSRARTIARTETLTAVSIGQSSMMNQAGSAIKGLKKAWVTAQDEDVRETHKQVNGEIKDYNEDFSNGLRYPRDTRGDAGETINCRCTLVTLPPEDLEEYRDELESLKETAR
jgi:HK97 family phage portal protein